MKIIIFLLTITLIQSIAFAANPLSLEDCLRLAKEKNPLVLAAQQDVKTSQEKWREAVSGWLPKFNVYFDSHYYNKTPYQKNNGEETVEIVPGIKIPATLLSTNDYDYYETRMGLSINQTLVDSGALVSQIQLAKLNLELSTLNQKKVEQEIGLRVMEKYYKLLELERKNKIHLKQLENAKELLGLAKKRNQMEEVGELEVIDQEIQVESLKQDLDQTLEDQETAKRELADLLDLSKADLKMSGKEKFEAAFSKERGLDEIISKTKKENLEIQQSQLKVRIKQVEIVQVGSDYRPRAALYGDLTAYKTGQSLWESMEKFDQTWVMGIKLDWPIFDSGKTIHKVAAADSDSQKSRDEHENAIDESVLQASRIYQNLVLAKGRLKLSSRKHELSKKKFELAQRFYDNEKISRSDLAQREIEEEESELEVLMGQMDCRLLSAKLNYISGGGMVNEN